ncbi:hypothetical protein [Enemella sp. A6]|uniref:hypothetical protein n=1 Tax=Enemella sp. A6 TaxID=3440152 RepID=UPI003EBB4AC4
MSRSARRRAANRAATDRVVASLQTPKAEAINRHFPTWLVLTIAAVGLLSLVAGMYAASSFSYRLGAAPSTTLVRTGEATIESCGHSWWPHYVPTCTARVTWDSDPRPFPKLRTAGDDVIEVHPLREVSGTIRVTSYVDNSMTLARPRLWGDPDEWVVPADTPVGHSRYRWLGDLLHIVLPLGLPAVTVSMLSGPVMRRARRAAANEADDRTV